MNLGWRAPKKIRMRGAMVRDQVAAVGNLRKQCTALARKSSNHEESSRGLVAIEKLEQLRSNFGIGTIVEGDGQLARGICPPHRGAKQLGARIDGAVSRDGGRRHCHWRGDEPWIHRAIVARTAAIDGRW